MSAFEFEAPRVAFLAITCAGADCSGQASGVIPRESSVVQLQSKRQGPWRRPISASETTSLTRFAYVTVWSVDWHSRYWLWFRSMCWNVPKISLGGQRDFCVCSAFHGSCLQIDLPTSWCVERGMYLMFSFGVLAAHVRECSLKTDILWKGEGFAGTIIKDRWTITRGGWKQGREVGRAGVMRRGGGKGGKLYLSNKKKFKKCFFKKTTCI